METSAPVSNYVYIGTYRIQDRRIVQYDRHQLCLTQSDFKKLANPSRPGTQHVQIIFSSTTNNAKRFLRRFEFLNDFTPRFRQAIGHEFRT